MRVAIQGLSKAYGSVVALRDLNLEIAPGQIVALIGPNGAGKTTLLRCLAAIAGPDEGTIHYDGELFRRDRVELRRKLAFLPDTPLFWPRKSVLQHLSLVLRIYEGDLTGAEDRALELLRDFDLLPLAESPVQPLSRGQIYKTMLASLLLARPPLWLLDEPFGAGMDPRGLAALKRHLRAIVEEGGTVLYSTQLLEVAENFSDRLCILRQGHAIAFDTAENLRQRPEVGLEDLLQID